MDFTFVFFFSVKLLKNLPNGKNKPKFSFPVTEEESTIRNSKKMSDKKLEKPSKKQNKKPFT